MTVFLVDIAGRTCAFSLADIRAAQERARELLPVEPQTTPAPPAPVDSPTLLTPEELAARSHNSRTWWIRKARRGEIECTRVGRLVRFTPEQAAKALSGPASLDHGITNANTGQKPASKQELARQSNSGVTTIVRPRYAAGTPSKGAQ